MTPVRADHNEPLEVKPWQGARLLFIVSREAPARYDYLTYAFADTEDVKVIFDRRHRERRHANDRAWTRRSQADRRSQNTDTELRARGWTLVKPLA